MSKSYANIIVAERDTNDQRLSKTTLKAKAIQSSTNKIKTEPEGLEEKMKDAIQNAEAASDKAKAAVLEAKKTKDGLKY